MNSNKNNIIKKIENLKNEDKNKNDMIKIHRTNYNSNTKCWWCRNLFKSHSINMPISYINDTFTVQGHFCSFNCCLSYSIDMRDNKHFYRRSLIHYYYYKLFDEFINITPAPHWRCLKDFGGPLTIEEFRYNNLTKEYILLEPPIKARTSCFLELDRKRTNDEYVLRRSKPIKRKTSNKRI